VSRIFLIGFMGSGKSTVGRLLGEHLGSRVVDLDTMIEERSGRSIPAIFAEDGEEAFRALEHDALAEACEGPDAVIACGGGVVLRDENRAMMRQCGIVIYLAVSAEEALARIGDTSGRPLLARDSAKMAHSILEARLSLYRASAHHIVDTVGRDAEEVALEVLAAVREAEIEVVRVSAGAGYEIQVGVSLLESLGDAVATATGARRVAVVTDTNVDTLVGSRVVSVLSDSGMSVTKLVIPAGESSKSWEQAGRLLEQFATAGLDRGSAVLALGGGVVGDLAGFCAATYMRGIALIHVPTTLLAQVDSSIGGKTAVDLEAGKNLAGAFWQPSLVITDTSLVQTLPDAEWQNGLAEIAKTALLQGADEVDRLMAQAPHLLARDEHAVHDAVMSCVRFKAGVVSDDEREAGLRECLNLGHTLGHAIEKVAGYGTVPHGVAIAEGMRFAADLAEDILGAPLETAAQVNAVLDALGIPVIRERYDRDALMRAMLTDKKSRDSVVRFALLRTPGDWEVVPVAEGVLSAALDRWSDRV